MTDKYKSELISNSAIAERRFAASVAALAFLVAPRTVGMRMDTRMAMIAITTSISTRVKPFWFFSFFIVNNLLRHNVVL